jgi:hypothetical protein
MTFLEDFEEAAERKPACRVQRERGPRSESIIELTDSKKKKMIRPWAWIKEGTSYRQRRTQTALRVQFDQIDA